MQKYNKLFHLPVTACNFVELYECCESVILIINMLHIILH